MPSWIQKLRFLGSRGGTIEPHRSLATVALDRRDIAISALLSLALTVIWLLCINLVTVFWGKFISLWLPLLDLGSGTQLYRVPIGNSWISGELLLPGVSLTARTPGATIWIATFIITLLLFALSFFMRQQFLPFSYLTRWFCAIQATALFYFLFFPASFPYTLPQYLQGLLVANLAIVSLIPAVLGLTYYIFDFSLPKKLVLTLCLMGHLLIFAPLQFLVQAYLISTLSLLYMPVLHLLFGIPLSVLIIVSIYAWGMSWQEREGARR